MTEFEKLFAHQPILAMVRDLPLADTVQAAELAWDAGIHAVEVSIRTPDQLAALTATAQAGRRRGQTVGAGDVCTTDQVRAAVAAGAGYTAATGLDVTVLAASLTMGLPHLPGVATPSEVQSAHAIGCRWVKAFPAVSLGPRWFTDMDHLFPHMLFVSTGGITLDNASEYLGAGAAAVGVGNPLLRPDEMRRLVASAEVVRSLNPNRRLGNVAGRSAG
jgi:Entner-Doudoroff aldolase